MKYENLTLQRVKELTGYRTQSPINWKILGKYSHYSTYLLLKIFPISANQVTILWGLMGIGAIGLIATGNYMYSIIGVVLFHFALVIDHADGVAARLVNKPSSAGLYLEYIFHYIHRYLLVLGIGFGLYLSSGYIIYLLLGIWGSSFIIFDNINKIRIYEVLAIEGKMDFISNFQKHYIRKTEDRYRIKGKKIWYYFKELMTPNEPFSFLFISIIFGVPWIFLIVISGVSSILLLVNLRDTYFKMKYLEDGL